ncbi:MAG: SUMF1/EgtB/PvdO family nonheme iron enzyme [Planctomycetota bacterium]|nr:SUMF1/EgtB/PvdO family nonheme iron enzyme [Planctomycetota bacterium]MDA1212337.1 SUMF1/EgtB/PvdO family nonheme iron enzyme [Planctomycetota bacterium]
MSVRWRSYTAVVLVVASAVAGCGSDAESPQAPASNVPPPQPIAIANHAAPVTGFSSGISPQQAEQNRKASEAKAREDFINATTDRNDFFRVSNDLPNYLVAGEAPDYAPEDLALVTAVPLDRQGASSFVVESEGDVSSTNGRGTVKLPDGFVPLPKFGVNSKGEYHRIWCEKDQSLMALVSEGTFQLGDDRGPSDAQPENIVDLDSYYIDIYEVTVAQFQSYINDIRGTKSGPTPQPYNISGKGDDPIRGLNWGEARGYVRWVGKDLPTEAEWEKAARGPNGFPHPWGTGRAIWTRNRDISQIDPVGSFQHDVSYYGLFDMAGNVREWCLDHYTADAYSDLAKAVPKVRRNWSGPRRSNPSNHHVVRGNGPDWVLWQRWPTETASRPQDVGFRGVLHLSAVKGN